MRVTEDVVRFNRLFKSYDDCYAGAARKSRLPELSLWILYTLRDIPDCTQKDLTDTLLRSKQSIQSALRRLLDEGLVTLETDKRDHRCKRIQLTEKGQEVCSRTADRVIHAERRAFAKFTDAERAEFLERFEQLRDAVRTEMNKL